VTRIYVGFDDTDTIDADRGTGKLARWFAEALPHGCTTWGVVRQQLLVHPDVPFTSHNSAAVVVIDAEDDSVVPELIELGIAHLDRHMIIGSDPGLCVVAENSPARASLEAFGARASVQVVGQPDAYRAAEGAHLSGHGGTEDGVIGAAAGVGLTMAGWSGRFIHYGDLRAHPTVVDVATLESAGMLVVPVDRNVVTPKPTDEVDTCDWVRPRLWGGRAVLPVVSEGDGRWTAIARRAPDPREYVRP
jgi:hypothetical protein